MMDGRVEQSRQALMPQGYIDVGISPPLLNMPRLLRSVVDAPILPLNLATKKTYQMDAANAREAFKEAALILKKLRRYRR